MKLSSLTLKTFSLIVVLGLLLALVPGLQVGAQSEILTLTPVADALVDQSNLNKNFGSSSSLSVDNSPVIRTYLRFDVPGLNGRPVTRAVLRLFATDGSHSGFSVSTVNNDWSEKKITFRKAPSIGSSVNSIGGYGGNAWIEIELTGLIIKEGLVSLALTTTADTTTYLASREAGANAPQLVLSLGSTTAPTEAAPTATSTRQPTVVSPTVTSTSQPTAVSPTNTPTRQATTVPTATPTTKPTSVPTSTPTESSEPMPYGQSGTWYLKFSDEFSGTQLDLNKWEPNWLAGNDTAITKPVNSHELSCYDPAQVSVANGSLKLSAVQRSCRANNGITYNYASGLVNSRRHYTFSYGYMEARVWLDGTSKILNWPAFWANGTGTWPTTGEIDVFEGLNGRPSWHYHWGTSSDHKSAGGYPTLSNPVGWHIFAAEWQAGSVKFYYDGQYVGQTTEGIVSGPMYLILNYGLSSTISPPVFVPSYYLVDYVRVWQKNP